jgi:hypothetical protein
MVVTRNSECSADFGEARGTTAASITRLQFSEWYGTSKQKFKIQAVYILIHQ